MQTPCRLMGLPMGFGYHPNLCEALRARACAFCRAKWPTERFANAFSAPKGGWPSVFAAVVLIWQSQIHAPTLATYYISPLNTRWILGC